MTSLDFLLAASVLFGIGLATILYRRNLLGMILGSFVSNGALMLGIVVLSERASRPNDGVLFAILILCLEVCMLLVGVSILYRRFKLGAPLFEEKESEQ